MLTIGTPAPDFCLSDDQGNTITLSDFKGKRLIVYFYPKDHTPGCTKESCDFRDAFNSLAAKNVAVVGVSRDSVASHDTFKQKHALPFPLLADIDSTMCQAYGVLKEKSMFGKKYMGIVRTTFLIDEQGKIINIFPKVNVLGHVKKLLALV